MLVPVETVEVASLILTCGTCANGFEVDYNDLDQESGMLMAESAYGHCPECDAVYDASTVTFSAGLHKLGPERVSARTQMERDEC